MCSNRRLAKIVFSLLLMFLTIQMLGATTLSAGALEFEVKINFWGSGNTFIYLPPFGKIIAQTHFAPLDLNFSLRSINLEQLPRSLEDILQMSLSTRTIVPEIKTGLLKYFLILLLFVFFLGLTSPFFYVKSKTSKKEAILLGSINFLVIFSLLLMTFSSYNPDAFFEAEYEGVLEAAPLILNAFDGGLDVINDMGLQFSEVVNNLSHLQTEMEKELTPEERKGSKTVLHVSDIHNNPAAFQFVKRMVDTFHVDLIIDTGDMVDYGTVFEVELFEQILAEINIPYVFIPGNHESPSTVSYLQNKSGKLTVLEEGTLEVAGLRIAGLADPASHSTEMVVAEESKLEAGSKKLSEIVHAAGGADIIVTHNPKLFKYLRHSNNLLLSGHVHYPYVTKGEDFLEINAGTAGASGIRGIQNLDKMYYSLVLINFQQKGENSYLPVTADLIKVKYYPLNFSLERFLLNEIF